MPNTVTIQRNMSNFSHLKNIGCFLFYVDSLDNFIFTSFTLLIFFSQLVYSWNIFRYVYENGDVWNTNSGEKYNNLQKKKENKKRQNENGKRDNTLNNILLRFSHSYNFEFCKTNFQLKLAKFCIENMNKINIDTYYNILWLEMSHRIFHLKYFRYKKKMHEISERKTAFLANGNDFVSFVFALFYFCFVVKVEPFFFLNVKYSRIFIVIAM